MAKDYVTELENLKTSLLGYDREAVMALIGEILADREKEKEEALGEIQREKDRLIAENAGLYRELETRKQVYEEMVKRVDQLNLAMDASMDKIGGYARESADALETYRRREAEMAEREEESRKTCKELTQKTQEDCEALRSEAQEEAEKILAEAKAEAENLTTKARETREQILKEAQNRMNEIIEQGKTKAQKQKEEYAYYRQCLRSFCGHINEVLKETDKTEARAEKAKETIGSAPDKEAPRKTQDSPPEHPDRQAEIEKAIRL